MDRRLEEMLRRQAAWQLSRAGLSWEEKIRLSKVMREAQKALREGFAARRAQESRRAMKKT